MVIAQWTLLYDVAAANNVMPIFGTVLSAVNLPHVHPYSLCVAASTPTHPVLSHGRSSLDQCWLSKESDALSYVHLFQVTLHPAIG